MVLLAAVLIGYLPGALFFRLPLAQRERRAALAAEERLFWQVLLSLAWSLVVVLALAAAHRYRFVGLLAIDAAICVVMAVGSRGRLRYEPGATAVSWTAVLPIVLIALGAWRFFPPSEYIIGGKDPGTYINEGIQIAQRGTLVIRDDTIAAVPAFARDLFFPSHGRADYYGTRFMGFFLQDPVRGDVVGQLPHLFPASIAIGYGLDGLTGARLAVGVWGILGLLAVYFAGARAFGPAGGFTAAVLLSLNVLEVFFGRYPNAELALQTCLFAAVLAFARVQHGDDRFFAPVAGVLAGLLVFLNTPYAVLALVAFAAAALLIWIVERRPPPAAFVLTLALALTLGGWYLTGPMRAYFSLPLIYAGHLPVSTVAGAIGGVVLIAGGWIGLRWLSRERARLVVAWGVIGTLLVAAAYAWFLRRPGGKLTDYDAYALRTFTEFYLLPIGLAAALAGLVLNGSRGFWRDPAMTLVIAAFSLFLFYKIKIVPNHFWAGRRILPVILPGVLLLASGAAFGTTAGPARRAMMRAIVGGLCLAVLGVQYLQAAGPVMPHVEYRGMIPYLERLASAFTERDLVLVESKDAESDVHVLALPLDYIYARHVLVLNTARPDKVILREFLADALKKYDRVFFMGGGGTDLLSRKIAASLVASEKVRVPEFEASLWNTYPRTVRGKDFEYGIYQLKLGGENDGPFSLDVGDRDDLNVVRFGGKETTDGHTFRWTRTQSFVSITGLTGTEREVVLVMNDGGRPAKAPPARVVVFLNDVRLGEAVVGLGFQPYRFVIPGALAAAAAGSDDPAQLRLNTIPWNPHRDLGVVDDRTLGVMVDRVDIH